MNLPNLIKTGESETVEFKEKFDERTIEPAVAFANTKGGAIFIGVSDKNNIKGIKIGKMKVIQFYNRGKNESIDREVFHQWIDHNRVKKQKYEMLINEIRIDLKRQIRGYR